MKVTHIHVVTDARVRMYLPFFVLLSAVAPAMATTADDYLRADQLRRFDSVTLGGRVFPIWSRDDTRFAYQEYGANEEASAVFLVDPRKETRVRLFSAQSMARALAEASHTEVSSTDLPKWHLNRSADTAFFETSAGEYRCEITMPKCQLAASTARPAWAIPSPDGLWEAFIWDHNVYVRPLAPRSRREERDAALTPPPVNGNHEFARDLESNIVEFVPGNQRSGCDLPVAPGETKAAPLTSTPPPVGSVALTDDGSSEWSYGRLYKMGAEVATLDADRYRPTHGALVWSPDSRWLLARREDIRGIRTYPLYSSTSNHPVDHSYYYATPGDQHFPQYDFYLLDVVHHTSKHVEVPPTSLIDRPGGAEWTQDSRYVYVLSSDLAPNEVRLSRVNAETGDVQVLIRETSATHVQMSNGGEDTIVAIEGGGSDILWYSERDGWGHLYRFGPNGVLKNQVEQGNYSVAELIHIEHKAKKLFFTAWGKRPGIPYYRYLYEINYDGSGEKLLTPELGDHLVQWAPRGDYFIDTYSSIDIPPVSVVRSSTGQVLFRLSDADLQPLKDIGWLPAETFKVKARDGVTDLYGVMYKPSNFDERKRYPIITNVYPGPFTGSVDTWSFQSVDNYYAQIRATEWKGVTHGEGMGRSLAELGFIVIKLDALGSARRSKSIRDFYWGRVLDNGLPDQVGAIKQLAERFPWIDATRVGIFGHSGGGFSSAAGILLYPDFFKVAVSESGNNDFRTYGWYWGSAYQGPLATPADALNYEAQATYKYASNLKGKLLLMHGDMDCNNPPAQTLRLVDALVKNNKDFDMLLIPDMGHQLPSYAMKRAWDYFVRNLRDEEPPAYTLLSEQYRGP